MTPLRLVAFSLAIPMLAGCNPVTTGPTTDAVKAAPDKPGVARSQPPVSNPIPDAGERPSVEGGGGY